MDTANFQKKPSNNTSSTLLLHINKKLRDHNTYIACPPKHCTTYPHDEDTKNFSRQSPMSEPLHDTNAGQLPGRFQRQFHRGAAFTTTTQWSMRFLPLPTASRSKAPRSSSPIWEISERVASSARSRSIGAQELPVEPEEMAEPVQETSSPEPGRFACWCCSSSSGPPFLCGAARRFFFWNFCSSCNRTQRAASARHLMQRHLNPYRAHRSFWRWKRSAGNGWDVCGRVE